MNQSEAMTLPRPDVEDRQAEFAEFYQRELDQQFRRARLIVGSKAVADDVVHDAFVELWRRWDSIREPGPYLNRTVVNKAMTVQQTGQRRMGILRRFWPVSTLSVEGPGEVLTDVLGQLPVKQRTAIVLRYYAGLPESEIAAVMDCPVGSIGPWISRGLGQLREALS